MPDLFRETQSLIECPSRDERLRVLGGLFVKHKPRLRRMVALRIDRRLQGRIDPSDVLQEAFLEASKRLDDYLGRPDVPAFLWLRVVTGQKLVDLHRQHLGAQMRDVRREVALHHGAMPQATSAALAAQLLGQATSVTRAAARAEIKVRLQEALNGMEPAEREILVLRHFEHLTNAEAAQVLGLQEAAARKRYFRALKRLKGVLSEMGLGAEEVL